MPPSGSVRMTMGGSVFIRLRLLLLSRLVGGRHRQPLHDQFGEMERASEKLSGDLHCRRWFHQHSANRQVRYPKSRSIEATRRGGHASASILAGHHGGLPEGITRGERGNVGDQPGLQEGMEL